MMVRSNAQQEIDATRDAMGALRAAVMSYVAVRAEAPDYNTLIKLADAFTAHTELSEATVSNKVTGSHARLFSRLRSGAGCNVSTFNKVLNWFSVNWPEDLEWPRDIPRPAQKSKSNSGRAA